MIKGFRRLKDKWNNLWWSKIGDSLDEREARWERHKKVSRFFDIYHSSVLVFFLIYWLLGF